MLILTISFIQIAAGVTGEGVVRVDGANGVGSKSCDHCCGGGTRVQFVARSKHIACKEIFLKVDTSRNPTTTVFAQTIDRNTISVVSNQLAGVRIVCSGGSSSIGAVDVPMVVILTWLVRLSLFPS